MAGKEGEGRKERGGDLEKKVADGLVPAPGSHHECSETTVCAEGGVRPRLQEQVYHRVMAHIGCVHQWGPASCLCVRVCVCVHERGEREGRYVRHASPPRPQLPRLVKDIRANEILPGDEMRCQDMLLHSSTPCASSGCN